MLTIAFAGGGTGGHIYPGLAVASRVKEKTPCRIFWIGAAYGMDRSIVEGAGLEFYGIPAGKLRRNFSFKNFGDAFRVIAGFFAAKKILKKEKPLLLFSKGGFVSVPPCAAAAALGITVITHESDFSPGLATRLNARFACKGKGRIITAYEKTASYFPRRRREKITALGNPVRPEFRGADPAKGRAFLGVGETERILLVLGGSQGARELNELVYASLDALTVPYVVVHQTGAGNNGEALSRAARYKGRYKPFAYINEEMPCVLAAAELVAGRSGAGTVWECAAAGKAMVLAPLTGSGTRGDQSENARCFAGLGAALVLESGESGAFTALILSLAGDEAKRNAMSAAAFRIGERDARVLIADAILEAAL
ncbi:MAG: undecaprenyldiphospho-muramoylpentapeptide beta-N-acetylglucosaminyltransferase [Treponema sp.]|jgi:UDP-N-acetylglucosamine--N-acetylmuramyl-(pentapeptide) pyrophosphoryl-undecaprenol N-acetylglucosamine transferase|nr:undecaprenyldiphospho-muramoylpentapeptide beta-N-acetylglucosaminyltransferase [Treponema sp.]